MNCCDRGKTIDNVDRIAFCPLEETSVCDSKSFKDLLEVLKKGDEVWCVSAKHLGKDGDERLKYVKLINEKGATVIFANERIMCAPEEGRL